MNKLTWNDIIDILQITVPFITAVLLAYINLKSNENTKKKETLDKRFYNFYFPFFSKIHIIVFVHTWIWTLINGLRNYRKLYFPLYR